MNTVPRRASFCWVSMMVPVVAIVTDDIVPGLAVMEGSWGSEATMVADADAALALLRAEVQAGDVVLVKASNSAGLGALAEALVTDDQNAAR